MFVPIAGSADEQEIPEALELAVELYEAGSYEDARQILNQVDHESLGAGGVNLFRKYHPLIAGAAGRIDQAYANLDQADSAVLDHEFAKAGRLLAAVLTNDFAPLELKTKAHRQIVKVATRSSGRARDTRTRAQAETKPALDHTAIAKSLVNQGMEELGQGAFLDAETYFTMAGWHVPAAPHRAIIFDPGTATVIELAPGNELEWLPLGDVHRLQVVSRTQQNVTLNLQLSVGRLVGMNTFQFTNSPNTGPGFVQLPIVQSVQIKTTVTAPAEVIPLTPNTRGKVQEYFVLIRPDP